MNTTMPPPDDGEPPRRGRPSKLTDELFRRFIALFLQGSFKETACRELGVAFSTFKSWMAKGRNDPGSIHGEFLAAVECAMARNENRLFDRVNSAALDDWRAAAWKLARMNPRLYGDHKGETGELKRRIRTLEKQLAEVMGETAAEVAE